MMLSEWVAAGRGAEESAGTRVAVTRAAARRAAAHATPRPARDRAGLTDVQLERLFLRYGALISRWGERVLGDGRLGDAVLQEVMLRLSTRGAAAFVALTSESRRRAWLYRASMRICWELRSSRPHPPQPTPEALALRETVRVGSCDQSELWGALDVEERVFALLHFEEGYTTSDIHCLTLRSRAFIDDKLERIAARLERIRNSLP